MKTSSLIDMSAGQPKADNPSSRPSSQRSLGSVKLTNELAVTGTREMGITPKQDWTQLGQHQILKFHVWSES